jgi:hypothetical protein
MHLRNLANTLVDLFDVPLRRRDTSPPSSACDAVAQAAAAHGAHFAYHTVVGWCLNRNQEEFRRKADEVTEIMKEHFLIDKGILKPKM